MRPEYSSMMKSLCLSCLWAMLLGVAAAGPPGEERPVYLDARDAKTFGEGIGKREGYLRDWNKTGSGAQWTFSVERPGVYFLYLESASPASEGGELAITLDGQKAASVPVPSTDGFDDFRIFPFARLELRQGEHTLAVTCETLKRTHLMDIRFALLTREENLGNVVGMVQGQERAAQDLFDARLSFAQALAGVRNLSGTMWSPAKRDGLIELLREHFPHQWDWMEQDSDGKVRELIDDPRQWSALFGCLANTSPDSDAVRQAFERLGQEHPDFTSPAWAETYERLAWTRRLERLERLRAFGSEIIFAKHHVFGSVSGIYLITETEGSPLPSSLCVVDLAAEKQGTFAPVRTLFDPGEGMVRDPELSYDGTRLLFAVRPTKKHFDSTYSKLAKGMPEMNYQIHEMDLSTGVTRALTDTSTYGSSFEPCYLPNGDIMFSSARIVQHITCGWGDHSNLFIMNKDGKYARRIGFDQTNTAFPVALHDGRVIFTRRDYNDRGQSSAHSLFQMSPDGTGQTEFYGNQTGLPNSFHHARPIPGSHKVMCIIGGYHTTQGGKLGIIDPRLGTQKDEGLVEMPGYRKPLTGDGYDDRYGKEGTQYSNPYPLSETDYIVSMAPRNARDVHYGLYYMNDRGERELLAADPQVSCLQGIMKMPRKRPPTRPTFVDYRKGDGVFYVQNVYHGPAARGIRPGSVKKLRVIEILFKNATIGTSKGTGPGGCWDTVIPSGHGLATFDSKRILGDATVHEDGSAMFVCDARKPVYFQLLDEHNRVVQTMRSWAVLMPGEKFSCIGCHEHKHDAPLDGADRTMASVKGAETLTPFYGEARAFSYPNEIQPIFDKHCISCHRAGGEAAALVLTREPCLDDRIAKKRFFRSYYELTNARPENAHKPEEFGFYPDDPIWGKRVAGKRHDDEPNRYVSWYTRFELMKLYPPYRTGSVKSGLVQTLEKGHQGVKLSGEELDKIRAWIDLNIPFAGEYDESNIWDASERKLYDERIAERMRNERIEADNIRQFIEAGQPR